MILFSLSCKLIWLGEKEKVDDMFERHRTNSAMRMSRKGACNQSSRWIISDLDSYPILSVSHLCTLAKIVCFFLQLNSALLCAAGLTMLHHQALPLCNITSFTSADL